MPASSWQGAQCLTATLTGLERPVREREVGWWGGLCGSLLSALLEEILPSSHFPVLRERNKINNNLFSTYYIPGIS